MKNGLTDGICSSLTELTLIIILNLQDRQSKMSRRKKKKKLQKHCMYLCMNAYLVSFGNIDFCGFKVPQLISGYVKKMPMFSNLSIRNIEKQFKKGLLIFYCKNRKRCIIWEHKLQLLKAEDLTEDLINLVVEMYKLRLTVLKAFVEELFSFEDSGYIEVMCHDLGLSEKETDNVIKKINSGLNLK